MLKLFFLCNFDLTYFVFLDSRQAAVIRSYFILQIVLQEKIIYITVVVFKFVCTIIQLRVLRISQLISKCCVCVLTFTRNYLFITSVYRLILLCSTHFIFKQIYTQISQRQPIKMFLLSASGLFISGYGYCILY